MKQILITARGDDSCTQIIADIHCHDKCSDEVLNFVKKFETPDGFKNMKVEKKWADDNQEEKPIKEEKHTKIDEGKRQKKSEKNKSDK